MSVQGRRRGRPDRPPSRRLLVAQQLSREALGEGLDDSHADADADVAEEKEEMDETTTTSVVLRLRRISAAAARPHGRPYSLHFLRLAVPVLPVQRFRAYT
ncbi:hypothetical protein HMN09_00862300 [Mycena chlorophos]|uniref:Uncharacterized protein n=1 Tax=Mycena chlorophos TaxID=658473 RepID=A0A8H6W4G4_MYCCL|nr:hypothetical protein HMN09_00862300 [Mycena chlorophos]